MWDAVGAASLEIGGVATRTTLLSIFVMPNLVVVSQRVPALLRIYARIILAYLRNYAMVPLDVVTHVGQGGGVYLG